MKIAVLGVGMVGRAIALDLARDHDVIAFDLSKENLELLSSHNPDIPTAAADLADCAIYHDLLQPFDIVVTAVPGFMGYKTVEAVLQAGKNLVDISFFPEDALQLDPLAKKKNLVAITDCGVAPGMSNLILGRYAAEMDVNSFECYVGGLPKYPKPPFYYRASFSPVDVIQEYVRPARIVENGNVITKPAMSDREIIYIDGVGELEAFNTDGLRSLVHTMSHIPFMKEKTLRYPGHIELISAMQQAGFLDTQPHRIKEVDISPLEFTTKLLIDQWKLEPAEPEFTVMRAVVRGEMNGKPQTIQYDLYDEYDPATGLLSMARTTGFTCTAAVNLIARDMVTDTGILPPELIGRDGRAFDFILNYLKERGVIWKSRKTEDGSPKKSRKAEVSP
ncbi:MAG TPA: saccharopine dehydrogenase C-terminal domain-containing protein [Chitinophagaceae bacterium]|nr:saccharopine dehydrogenase C-terminal domain-containing protein [Chitinophagaceae bacterium]